MSTYAERIETQRSEWKSTFLGRLNHGYSVLSAKRSRLDDDNPKKHGRMLKALRVFERKIRKEAQWNSDQQSLYYQAAELSDKELRRHYSVSTSNNDTCGTCFCCICGKVLADRAAGKEQAFPFKE